jgi:hypothetical protein
MICRTFIARPLPKPRENLNPQHSESERFIRQSDVLKSSLAFTTGHF